MAITIDKAPCTQEELGVILLVNAFQQTKSRNFSRFVQQTLTGLVGKGLIQLDAGKATLTDAADSIVGSIDLGQSSIDFTALATKMRELFPQGMKPETSHLWRSSTKIVAERLAKLYDDGYTFTEEEALEATKAYVKAKSSSPYMRILKYFVWKYQTDDSGRQALDSELYTWIEQIRDGVQQEEPTTLSNFY